MSIDPPLPAVSRPSNRTTIPWFVSDTQRAIAPSSLDIGFRSSSYSSSLSLVFPLIQRPHCAWRCGTRRRRLEPPAHTVHRARMTDQLLRVVLTALHRLLKLNWRVRRPRMFGAPALALTPERQDIP